MPSTARTAGTTSSSPRPSPHVTKGALSLDSLVTPEVAEVLQRTLAEILGLAQGYCAGRRRVDAPAVVRGGRARHDAIVGGGVPMAKGNAWAQKHSYLPGGRPPRTPR